jgi:glutaredoxin-like protein NrdH
MKRVVLYSLSTCAVCRKVKKFLDEHAIPYTVIEVDTLDSGEQWLMTKELSKHNPQGTYPTLVIEDIIKGYDVVALESKLLKEGSDPSLPAGEKR